jgi:hypothetical protein
MRKKRKTPKKKHYKSACFYAPQNGFSFLDQTNWHMHKLLKNDRKITNNFPQKQQNIPTFLHLKKKNHKINNQFTRSLEYENLQKISITRLVGAKFLAYFYR